MFIHFADVCSGTSLVIHIHRCNIVVCLYGFAPYRPYAIVFVKCVKLHGCSGYTCAIVLYHCYILLYGIVARFYSVNRICGLSSVIAPGGKGSVVELR